jgi:gamma-D-glutamyl-L-lysine dipeptidyl-peptidase
MLFLLFAALFPFYHVQVPTAAMYEAPDQGAEIISEAVFAEQVKILEERDDWVKIQTEDSCAGWAKSDAVVGRETIYADCTCVTPIVEVVHLFAPIYASPDAEHSPLLTVPFESRLEAPALPEEDESSWISVQFPQGTKGFVHRDDVTADIHALPKADLAAFSKQFLSVPFTPAGRSSFGFDSSGFVQMLYKQIGYQLPRSVQEQCDSEELETISMDALESGDLIFWGHSESDVEHVGVYIGDQQVIHSCEDQAEVLIRDLSTPFYKGQQEWTFRLGKRLK